MSLPSAHPRSLSPAPTVKDVAERAQVSPMTVSRVLASGKNVSPQARARVEQAAAELGYSRNEMARSLRPGHKSGLIGVTITNIANPYYAEMQLGIEEVAASHSRRILVGNSREDFALEAQLVSDFTGRRVEGIIVVPVDAAHSEHLRRAHLSGMPLTFASRSVPGIDVDTVLVDDIGGSQRATLQLIDEGHKRIGFLGLRASVSTGRRRLEGFRAAHRLRGIEVDDEVVRDEQWDATSAESAMDELLSLQNPPTAVFSSNNRNTIGAIRALELRRRADSDAPTIRLIGFDSFEFADLSPVPLSVVEHDARELGRRAAEMLFTRIEDDDDRPSRLLELPAELRLTPGF